MQGKSYKRRDTIYNADYKIRIETPPEVCTSKRPTCEGLIQSSTANIQTIFQNRFIMNRIISFLKESNRWKHLAGGFVVGLCACSAFGAVYSAAVAASCLELKDKLHGSPWDWTDWLLTVGGGVAASVIWMLL